MASRRGLRPRSSVFAERQEANMGYLRRFRVGLRSLLAREPAVRFGGNAGRDWLPPSLGPSDWTHGMMESMADRSAAWYFDRR